MYIWEMSRKLSGNRFKWVGDYIKSCNERSNEEYFLEDEVQYSENLNEPHNDLLVLLEIKNVYKFKKIVGNF